MTLSNHRPTRMNVYTRAFARPKGRFYCRQGGREVLVNSTNIDQPESSSAAKLQLIIAFHRGGGVMQPS
jgi:hypothetical protein